MRVRLLSGFHKLEEGTSLLLKDFVTAALLAAFLLVLLTADAEAQWTNEPAGSTFQAECDFNGTKDCGVLKGYYGGGFLDNLPSAPYSPGGVYYSQLAPGASNGNGYGTAYVGPRSMSEMYVAFYWKMSAGFEGYNHGNNKLFFMRDFETSPDPKCSTNGVFLVGGNGTTFPFTMFWTTNTGGYSPGQPNSNEGNPTCSNWTGGYNCYPNVSNVSLWPDQWYLIEAYVKASSCPNCKDGIIRWWVDGVLAGDVTNYNYGCGVVNDFLFDHTWDGQPAAQCKSASNPSGRDCSRDWRHYLDHLYISAPNCPGGCQPTGNTGGSGGGQPTAEVWNYDLTWQCPNVTVHWECPYDQPVCAAPGPRGSTRGSIAAWDNMLKMRWVPTFICMSHQMTVTMADQLLIAGTMLDAKTQLETQRLQQQLTAEAQKDYMPSAQMCSFGTNVRGLAASQSKTEANAQALSEALMNRDRLKIASAAATGPARDKAARLEQFKTKYCDINDNNGQLAPLCKGGSAPAYRRNRDIDFFRTLDSRYTLDFDMANGGSPKTEDEEDVMALASNLFAHDVFTPIAPSLLEQAGVQDELMEMRSVNAIRGVALDSFANIVAMKAEGSPGAAPFMRGAMRSMGLSVPEINELLGQRHDRAGGGVEPLNPSYFAQMEILTKKMYQSPEFFTNLYDTPDNVARMGVTLQAFQLMNDRDRFESALRREMLISLMLELKLRAAQTGVNNSILNNMSDIFPRR